MVIIITLNVWKVVVVAVTSTFLRFDKLLLRLNCTKFLISTRLTYQHKPKHKVFFVMSALDWNPRLHVSQFVETSKHSLFSLEV